LADVTRYNEKHNEANGEDNRDGHHANFSDNCGVEGDTDDKVILEKRARRQRNMLATLMFSQGTPMLLAGDEIGNSQGGNNNAYCQDNATSWIDWEKADTGLLDFVSRLSAFRKAHHCLRQTRFLHGAIRAEDGHADVEWRDFAGMQLNWRDPGLANVCLLIRCSAEAPDYDRNGDVVFIVFNAEGRAADAVLPEPPEGRSWLRAIDTAQPDHDHEPCAEKAGQIIEDHSVVAFCLSPKGRGH